MARGIQYSLKIRQDADRAEKRTERNLIELKKTKQKQVAVSDYSGRPDQVLLALVLMRVF